MEFMHVFVHQAEIQLLRNVKAQQAARFHGQTDQNTDFFESLEYLALTVIKKRSLCYENISPHLPTTSD